MWGERLGAPMQLPGSYVREHVSLGYACTKDSAQGRTVDTGHAVTQAAGLLRARHPRALRQHALRGDPATGADAETGETLDVAERAPEAVLADILAAVQDDRTALAEREHAVEESRSVMTQVDRMVDLIREVNAGRLAGHARPARRRRPAHRPPTRPAGRRRGVRDRWSGCCAPPSWPVTTRRPCCARAVEARDLDGVASPARVLHHRITGRLTGRLTPRLRRGGRRPDPAPPTRRRGHRPGRAARAVAARPRRGRRGAAPRARRPHRRRGARVGGRRARPGPGRQRPGARSSPARSGSAAPDGPPPTASSSATPTNTTRSATPPARAASSTP